MWPSSTSGFPEPLMLNSVCRNQRIRAMCPCSKSASPPIGITTRTAKTAVNQGESMRVSRAITANAMAVAVHNLTHDREVRSAWRPGSGGGNVSFAARTIPCGRVAPPTSAPPPPEGFMFSSCAPIVAYAFQRMPMTSANAAAPTPATRMSAPAGAGSGRR